MSGDSDDGYTCYWGWKKPGTGRPPAFDVDAAREAAGEDDPNPKGSVFFRGPKEDT